jgi:hypothetical protein
MEGNRLRWFRHVKRMDEHTKKVTGNEDDWKKDQGVDHEDG